MQGEYKKNTRQNKTEENRIKDAVITAQKEMTIILEKPCKIDATAMQKIRVMNLKNQLLLMAEVKPVIEREDRNGVAYAREYKVHLVNDFEWNHIYKVAKGDCGEKKVVFGNLYDSQIFEEDYTYTGEDLGVTYTKDSTRFRLWTPIAEKVFVLMYPSGSESSCTGRHELEKGEKGTWLVELTGNYEGQYFVYEIHINDQVEFAVDPYAKAVGVNGARGAIVDLEKTNPPCFLEHKKPDFGDPTDAVIYELHIRDLSVHEDSGIEKKGKFLGLAETGTKNKNGVATGLDHIKELGVTHVHLLPSFDYRTVDESKPEDNEFNWGYDPQNYNVPEGSYATNPHEAVVRMIEFKQMVQALHENGLRVVMDVVYNHTFDAIDSNFHAIMPKYYHRTDERGHFTNGSACGNEIASERSMVRKFIVDSVVYWAKEYHIDGFRFDLMALHDIETMNLIREELDKIDPSILIYGEGWTGSETSLPKEKQALKENAQKLNSRIAVFSDDIRDGIKGSVFEEKEAGFINGSTDKDEDVKFGIVGSVWHPQVDMEKVNYSDHFWANEPTQVVNYASAHDNLTLWDKLKATNPNDTEEDLIRLNRLSAAIVLTSQGIPFFHAGEEIARTKYGKENSYRSPDSVNRIDWERKENFLDLMAYYKGLIRLRKRFAAFRLSKAADIQKSIRFLDTESGVIAYSLKNNDDSIYKGFFIIFNATSERKLLQLDSPMDLLVAEEEADDKVLLTIEDSLSIKPKSAYVLGVRKVVRCAPTRKKGRKDK